MEDLELIERYHRNELTSSERAAYEQRLINDGAFRKENDFHKDALAAIRMEGRAAFRAGLAEAGRALDDQKKSPGWQGWGLACLAIFTIGLAWWFFSDKTPLPRTPVNDILIDSVGTSKNVPVDTAGSVPQATMPSEEKSKLPQDSPPTLPSQGLGTRTADQLFAANFKPYKEESLEPSVRGNDEPSPSELFQKLYWEGKYQKALVQFENLPSSAKNNDNQLFIKAECLLATGKAAAAAALFEKILANDRSRFMPVASWHLALAYLKNGDLDKAKKQLGSVAKETDSPWQTDAAAVLKALQ